MPTSKCRQKQTSSTESSERIRLPESTHLGRVRLQVADLERSVAFYEKVLGMRVIRRGNRLGESRAAW